MSRGAARRPGRSGVVIGLLAVVTAVLLVVFVVRLSHSPQAKVQLGTGSFVVGRAVTLQRRADQAPLLFQALHGSDLDIWVQHLGPDALHGWLAFATHRPGSPAACQLRWQPGPRTFVDPCDQQTYPADGLGLAQYRVSIDSQGRVTVDLRASTGTSPAPT